MNKGWTEKRVVQQGGGAKGMGQPWQRSGPDVVITRTRGTPTQMQTEKGKWPSPSFVRDSSQVEASSNRHDWHLAAEWLQISPGFLVTLFARKSHSLEVRSMETYRQLAEVTLQHGKP